MVVLAANPESISGGPLSAAEPTAKRDPPTVKLIVDFGDGSQKHFTQLTWEQGMTAWNALQKAQKHPRGIRVQSRGEGDTLLVTQIDDAANEATTGLNWIYRVNDKLGDRSAGITVVQPGDIVLWRLESYP